MFDSGPPTDPNFGPTLNVCMALLKIRENPIFAIQMKYLMSQESSFFDQNKNELNVTLEMHSRCNPTLIQL